MGWWERRPHPALPGHLQGPHRGGCFAANSSQGPQVPIALGGPPSSELPRRRDVSHAEHPSTPVTLDLLSRPRPGLRAQEAVMKQAGELHPGASDGAATGSEDPGKTGSRQTQDPGPGRLRVCRRLPGS